MPAARIVLRACAGRRRKGFGSASRGEQNVGSEARDQKRLAAEDENGQVVAARGSIGLDGRHVECAIVSVV